ncbi:hypothetical protein PC123_g17020 [Phytophthora cactorum]|nr:hypothetical protein PC123_g17020 [Phytophthora cactorum]
MDPNTLLLVTQGLTAGELELTSLGLDQEIFIALQRIQAESEDFSNPTAVPVALAKAANRVAHNKRHNALNLAAKGQTIARTPRLRTSILILRTPPVQSTIPVQAEGVEETATEASEAVIQVTFDLPTTLQPAKVSPPASTEPLKSHPMIYSKSFPASPSTSPSSPDPALPAESSGPKSGTAPPIVDRTGDKSDVEIWTTTQAVQRTFSSLALSLRVPLLLWPLLRKYQSLLRSQPSLHRRLSRLPVLILLPGCPSISSLVLMTAMKILLTFTDLDHLGLLGTKARE